MNNIFQDITIYNVVYLSLSKFDKFVTVLLHKAMQTIAQIGEN